MEFYFLLLFFALYLFCSCTKQNDELNRPSGENPIDIKEEDLTQYADVSLEKWPLENYLRTMNDFTTSCANRFADVKYYKSKNYSLNQLI